MSGPRRSPATTAAARPPDPAVAPAPVRRRPWLAGLVALNAVAAWGGALGLVSGWLTLGATIEQRLPLHSPVLGGVALALIVDVPSTVVAVEAWRGSPRTDQALVVAGVLLLGWIVVQALFIRELTFFHPFYLAVGAAMVLVGWRGVRRQPDV